MSKQLFLTLDKQKLLVVQKKSLKNNKEVQGLGESSVITIKSSDSGGSEEVVSTNGHSSEEGEEEEENTENGVDEGNAENSTDEESIQSNMDAELIEECSLSTKTGIKRKRVEANNSKNIKFGDETIKNFATADSITGPLPVLPGVSSFFNPRDEEGGKTSSDEEEEVPFRQ